MSGTLGNTNALPYLPEVKFFLSVSPSLSLIMKKKKKRKRKRITRRDKSHAKELANAAHTSCSICGIFPLFGYSFNLTVFNLLLSHYCGIEVISYLKILLL